MKFDKESAVRGQGRAKHVTDRALLGSGAGLLVPMVMVVAATKSTHDFDRHSGWTELEKESAVPRTGHVAFRRQCTQRKHRQGDDEQQ